VDACLYSSRQSTKYDIDGRGLRYQSFTNFKRATFNSNVKCTHIRPIRDKLGTAPLTLIRTRAGKRTYEMYVFFLEVITSVAEPEPVSQGAASFGRNRSRNAMQLRQWLGIEKRHKMEQFISHSVHISAI
jgi:hypothetical protein